MTASDSVSDQVKQADTPSSTKAPVQLFEERRPWVVVALGVALPGVYLAWWHAKVTEQLRLYGRCTENPRLTDANPVGAFLALTIGWVLVVPAAVCLMRTVRREQLCEKSCFETARPAHGLLSLLAVGEALGLLASLLTGVTIAVPVSLLIAGAVAAAILQARLNAVWRVTAGVLRQPVERGDRGGESALPAWSPWLHPVAVGWAGLPPRVRSTASVARPALPFLGYGAAAAGGFGVYLLGRMFAAQDRSGLFAGLVTAVCVIGLGVGISLLLGWSLRALAEGRAARAWAARGEAIDRGLLVVAGLGGAAAAPWLWNARPLFHGLLMPLYQWPLVTWIPLVLGLLFTAGCVVVSVGSRHGAASGLRAGIVWRVPFTVALWVAFMVMLPSLQGQALYGATTYAAGELPLATQPRVLPKVAAQAYGGNAALHDAHLVVDPASGELVWSAEHAHGFLRLGASDAVATQPLDRVDGARQLNAGGFDPAASRVGPGSLPWRAYDRHWFTRVQDAAIVPLGGGRAVAIAPYLGYRGFPVRHPYWAGVYVYHQDGRLEDLSPRQALARPELAGSGRLFPERLARAIAEAYGYRGGADAVLASDARTEVSDPSGNPQPYLTKLGPRRVAWVTIAHPAADTTTISAIFLTDSSTGTTQVWHPPTGARLLSNTGAAQLVRGLPLEWEGCCDGNGDSYPLRKVVEPTPVFAHGRLYYLVSVVPDTDNLTTAQPVDQTVIVDAARGAIVGQYDHADPGADRALRRFFGYSRSP